MTAVEERVIGPTPAFAGLRLVELPRTDALLALHTMLRDRTCQQARFVTAARRVIRLVLETSLGELAHEEHPVTTPLGEDFEGRRRSDEDLVAVSVPRAGDAMEAELREIEPGVRVGKILIQRDPATLEPGLIYTKLPIGIETGEVLLMDPMMATGGTVDRALDMLAGAGVPHDRVVLANLLTCPSALAELGRRRPGLRVVTSFVDRSLSPEGFMRPGMGDFGDRFYGTLR